MFSFFEAPVLTAAIQQLESPVPRMAPRQGLLGAPPRPSVPASSRPSQVGSTRAGRDHSPPNAREVCMAGPGPFHGGCNPHIVHRGTMPTQLP